MWEAVALGPHQLSQYTKTLAHFAVECAKKVRVGQAKLVLWDAIKEKSPSPTEDFTYCRDPPQVKGLQVNLRPILQPSPQERRYT